ncbi:MAG: hypothetical protein ACJAZO_004850 [Myxococcota bacterium]
MPSQTQLNLRGKDPTTLEVTLMDALSLTVGRLSVEDLVDMFALGEAEGLPKGLSRDLDAFARRIENEVADLPDGGELRDTAIALQDLPTGRVSERFRALLKREADRETRAKAERALLGGLMDAYEGTTPEVFPIGAGQGPRTVRTEQTPPPSSLKADKPKAKKGRAKKAAPRSARAVVVDDPEQTKWLRVTVMDRLSGYSEAGLNEIVLIAGIRHAARERYPRLLPGDIQKVLKELKESGQLRQVATRWSLPGRW